MLNIGDNVEGRVTDIHPFGVFLQADANRILILAPDLGEPLLNAVERFRLGDVLTAKIVLFNAKDNVYRGILIATGWPRTNRER